MKIRAKKRYGQHFLASRQVAAKVAAALTGYGKYAHVLEVGGGTGKLTEELLTQENYQLSIVEIDAEACEVLNERFGLPEDRILQEDFLNMDLTAIFSVPFALIGNFPYNISTQILFKVLENRTFIPEVVGMLQREVAQRICAAPGNKTYGILSVLIEAFYTREYLFSLGENVFCPPPKVKSAVIRLQRKAVPEITCSEALFFKVVKQSFQSRRKTLRNALKKLNLPGELREDPLMSCRAEELGVADFNKICLHLEQAQPGASQH